MTDQQEAPYEGWKNWETWNLTLWINNEEPLYRLMRSLRPFTPTKAREFARRVYPNCTPDMANEGRKGRFPYYKFVDWAAVAADFNDD